MLILFLLLVAVSAALSGAATKRRSEGFEAGDQASPGFRIREFLASGGGAALGPREKLAEIHKTVHLLHGSFEQEYQEQLMVATHLRPDARVLELGGNIGRNSMVIASILKRDSDLLVMECDRGIARQLTENRDRNGFGFRIEASAISRRPLVNRDWNSAPLGAGEPVPEGWASVDTMTWAEVTAKHGQFDTLVADCEGALYQILADEPDFFRGFGTVVVENDYSDIEHKRAVDAAMRAAGLGVVFQQGGGWGPCADKFFEVWLKSAPR